MCPPIWRIYWLERMRLLTQRNVIKDSCANNDNKIQGVLEIVTIADCDQWMDFEEIEGEGQKDI